MADLARPTWIAFASGAPLTDLAAVMDAAHLQVETDRERFGLLLTASRPQVAIVAAPPATRDDEALILRERRRRPSLRIVHLTRPDDVDRRLEALRQGFDEALTTAIALEELVTRLQILEERARVRHTSEVPVAHGVVLDPVAHEVRRGGALVHLRPKEFQLLAMLAAHPGRAYTRRQLLDRVWGPAHDGDPRTVDVHVRWLRAKIEPVPEMPVHLVTVRGVGYRLDPDPR
jgi:two-component system response regulator RegX3